ncbi:UDP-N-acetylglucosamine 2-epimerase (non-hydrolyzing) [Rhodoblastus acidophilus]|uniref:UDP-N-acetylglucosamine 2-epimerase (non-hydrolyzing) n=1 Tax=Candidatus Rhodoblastus alkanivorans TaxID=2954117 RepID=A0ABS9Z9W1_9HYPH|nr:UDP-N-acetylglucosamine 2-epimerase (non-hydrolyzing) [Candidatus Rhodoblastus alkanivorans]MCI4677055.1 UDP-N-acetylglucosamine 2-epimerase (non-hydrolyzing) [Candidatus Rhodoblastus alkanivorans]MCI4684408.1 UDP-N-acetylglucosamine 2-epimerase (non-hydrolyzing) [Candidatus Rhodoblastus alkanivorans]MDI4641729.1 UDP-N-acetylglucosamine 2-epimerase (non-hydrolyzing) [Rhodoblastus acidophilus]
MQKHLFVLVGTRPEAIKLFPVINRLKAEKDVALTVCATAQHRHLLDQVLKLAKVTPDVDLNIMTANQNLDRLTSQLVEDIGEVLERVKPTRVVVQGDTATAMTGALASYYHRIPVSHVEAGLRSGDIYAPWPEEVNRKIVGSIADQHFAPTQRAASALRAENVPDERIHVTGNTVVDALILAKAMVDADPDLASRWDGVRARHGNRRIILVTCHRRENFGGGVLNIVNALETILKREDVAIVLPAHPNPNVHDVFAARLSNHPRVVLTSPQEYTDFVSLLSMSYLVLTDSGGVQEEAPTFGKPVLVMRETTERPEGVEAGTARLVGSDYDKIVEETFRLLDDEDSYAAMARTHNPFGDGHASERIVKALLDA